MARCPGQDMRYWKPEDIFDVRCPYCDTEIEFWRDEPMRLCPQCGMAVRNPRVDLACAAWCAHAEECLGKSVEHHVAAAPVIERVRVHLERLRQIQPELAARAQAANDLADTILVAEGGDPRVVRPAAVFAALAGRNDPTALGAALHAVRETLAPVLADASALDHIAAIVEAVAGGRQHDSPECRIVTDAVCLAGCRCPEPASTTAGQGASAFPAMQTRAGELLRRRHQAPPRGSAEWPAG